MTRSNLVNTVKWLEDGKKALTRKVPQQYNSPVSERAIDTESPHATLVMLTPSRLWTGSGTYSSPGRPNAP